MKKPCIAIHGVGHQTSGDIKSAVQKKIDDSEFRDTVSAEEFNWDELIEHSSQNKNLNLIWFLEATAENISVSARLGLLEGKTTIQQSLGFVQFHLHRICQWIIALSIGVIVVGTASVLMMSLPNLLFNLPIEYGGIFRWIPTFLYFTFWLVTYISALLFIIGLSRTIISFSSSYLFMTIRSIVLLYLQPILVFASGMLVIEWKNYMTPVFLFGGFIFLILTVIYVTSLFNGQPFLYFTELKYLLYVILAASLLLFVQFRFTKFWFGTLIKVSLDIFRYLGDPRYRLDIQNAFVQKLESIRSTYGNNGQFILLSHSLGSIIAIDSLLTSRFWRQDDTVYVITMGSPIRRYFQRFFPNILLPNSMQDLAQGTASRVKTLFWINVFRPWDYVGTSLGLFKNGIGVDISTEQKSKILSSHGDYWDDGGENTVIKTITKALKNVTKTPRKPSDVDSPSYIIPFPPNRYALVNWFQNSTGKVSVISFTLIFLGSLYWVNHALTDRTQGLAPKIKELRTNGIKVNARVEYDRELIPTGENTSTYIHYYDIHYTDPITSKPKIEPFEFDESSVFPEHRQRFDERELASYIRSQCPEPWWKFWKLFSKGIPCEADNIQFRYLSNDSKFYDFPDFLPTDDPNRSLSSWFKTSFISLFISGFTLFPLAAGGSIFMLLLGHPPIGYYTQRRAKLSTSRTDTF